MGRAFVARAMGYKVPPRMFLRPIHCAAHVKGERPPQAPVDALDGQSGLQSCQRHRPSGLREGSFLLLLLLLGSSL